ncbi:MAG: cold-shock protein [Rhizomicrobium sp.]
MANYDTTRLAQASARGTIKWFNATKGYGFITLERGGDAFCHASALAAVGATDVPPGSTVVCDLQESPRGLQVVAVHSLDTSTAEAQPPRKPRGPGGGDDDRGRRGGFGRDSGGFGRDSGGFGRDSAPSGAMVDGRVKFFNDQKGFGFVVPENGGGDVYLHASALRRSGVAALTPEQRIRYSTRQGMKGVEVDRIEVL